MNINAYHNALRDQIELLKRRGKSNQLILHQVMPDETLDHTIISERTYKTRDWGDVVRIASGVNASWEPLPEIEIFLPTFLMVKQLRQSFGLDQ